MQTASATGIIFREMGCQPLHRPVGEMCAYTGEMCVHSGEMYKRTRRGKCQGAHLALICRGCEGVGRLLLSSLYLNAFHCF